MSGQLLSHLLELRQRLLRSAAVIVLLFGVCAWFADSLYMWVAAPLLSQLPAGAGLIATDVATPFLTPLKLALVAAMVLSVPYWLWQLWAFLAPGLYRHEKRLIMPLLTSSTLLFYVGIAFAYFIILPVALGFLTSSAPVGVTIATDISRYLDFVLTMFIAFGIAFETPVAIILLCWSGAASVQGLRHKRPYVIVGAFVVGMILTPPDVLSQILLAIPLWLLFELGLLIAGLYQKSPTASATMHE